MNEHTCSGSSFVSLIAVYVRCQSGSVHLTHRDTTFYSLYSMSFWLSPIYVEPWSDGWPFHSLKQVSRSVAGSSPCNISWSAQKVHLLNHGAAWSISTYRGISFERSRKKHNRENTRFVETMCSAPWIPHFAQYAYRKYCIFCIVSLRDAVRRHHSGRMPKLSWHPATLSCKWIDVDD